MTGAVGYAAARMWQRSTIGAAVAALAAAAVTGCGGSSGPPRNGVATRTSNQIVAAATGAIDSVSSVRVSGTVADGASPHAITLDLELAAGRGARGSLSENGLSFSLITVDGEAYLRGSPGFWRRFAGAAAQRRLRGRWLRGSATTGKLASFSSLTDAHALLAGLLRGHGGLTKGTVTTIRGRQAIALHDPSGHGTLYVATTGKPYPLRIAESGARGGELDFSDFGAPVTLSAPVSAIDIAQLRR